MLVGLSISPFSFVSFCFVYSEAILLGACTFRIIIFLINLPLHFINSPLHI